MIITMGRHGMADRDREGKASVRALFCSSIVGRFDGVMVLSALNAPAETIAAPISTWISVGRDLLGRSHNGTNEYEIKYVTHLKDED